MNKYIRTKDNIFEVVEENDKVYRVKAKSNPNNVYSKSKCQTDVIASADTIKELCDMIVEQGDFYGAIWTDKGLIYVAKMNEKGELELL